MGHLSFTEILDTSLKVSWQEPVEKNGIITGKYQQPAARKVLMGKGGGGMSEEGKGTGVGEGRRESPCSNQYGPLFLESLWLRPQMCCNHYFSGAEKKSHPGGAREGTDPITAT